MIESESAGRRPLARRHYDEAGRLLQGLLEAAEAFEEERLPELFCGIDPSHGMPLPDEEANSPHQGGGRPDSRCTTFSRLGARRASSPLFPCASFASVAPSVRIARYRGRHGHAGRDDLTTCDANHDRLREYKDV